MKRKRKNEDNNRPALRWIVPVLLLTVAMGILLVATINEQAEALLTPTPYPYDGRYVPRTATPNPIAALPHDQCMYTLTYQIQPRETFAAYETLSVPSPDGQYAVVREIGGGLYLIGENGARQYIDSNYDVMLYFIQRVTWSPDSRRVAIVASRVGLDLRMILLDVDGARNEIIGSFRDNNSPGLWSPDGRYWLEWGYEVVRVWDFSGDAPMYTIENGVVDITWSPVGHTFAYVQWTADIYVLVVHDLDSGLHTEYPLNYIGNRYTFYWSPDGQRLALQGGSHWGDGQHIIDVYSADGQMQDYIGYDIMYYANNEWTTPLTLQWLADSQHAVTYRHIEDGHYQLVTYDAAQNTSRVLFDNASRPPVIAPDGRYAVVYHAQGEGEVIQRVDSLTGEITPFIWYADDASDAYWSPDGRYAAVVWALGEGAERRLFLSWMDMDSGAVMTLDDGLWDVRHVYWMSNSQHLVYEAVRSNGLRLEIVNAATGETTILIDAIAATDYYTVEVDTLTLWWQTTDGQSGRDVYGADGTRVERWLWRGTIPYNLREFPAPDGTVIAIKAGGINFDWRHNDESLTLIYPDGRPRVNLVTNMTGLSDPSWSPDGRLLSFLAADGNLHAPTLHVYNTAGRALWQYANVPQWMGGFMWMACD